ncbi:MAG: hypothetical protein JJE25_01525 [Bacteroidia bacterium]|nr:hypothetical protein [Bacteroidia bacterium]
MKTKIKILTSVLLIAMTVTLVSFTAPNGWVKKGGAPEKYDAGIDRGAGQNGVNAATIKSIVKDIDSKSMDGFASLGQSFNPNKFHGKKIKLSGYIKTKDVTSMASLWMRIDQPTKYSLENMKNRYVRGNSDWTKCEIILDVPSDAKNIAFGGLLYGTGQMWFDNLKIEVANNSDKVLDELEIGEYEFKAMPNQNPKPANLDFSK